MTHQMWIVLRPATGLNSLQQLRLNPEFDVTVELPVVTVTMETSGVGAFTVLADHGCNVANTHADQ